MYHRVKCVQVVSWWSWNSRLKYLYFSKKKIKISHSGAVRLPFGQNEALVTRCRGWVRVLLCITCRCRKVILCPHQYDFDGSNRAYTMQKKLNTIRIHHVGGAIFTIRFAMETQDKFYHNSVVYQSFFPLSLSLSLSACVSFPLLSQTELAALSHRTNYVCLLLCWIYACSSFVERLHLCAAIFLSFLFTKICTSYSIHSGGYPKY